MFFLFVSPVFPHLLACGKIGMAKHSDRDVFFLREQTREEEEKTKPQTQKRRVRANDAGAGDNILAMKSKLTRVRSAQIFYRLTLPLLLTLPLVESSTSSLIPIL